MIGPVAKELKNCLELTNYQILISLKFNIYIELK